MGKQNKLITIIFILYCDKDFLSADYFKKEKQ